MVDLAPVSGENGLAKVWFAFHADDGGGNNWATGWAIDNVVVHNGPAPNLGYYVYLDDAFVAQTGVGFETYTYGDLTYGTAYKASVRAIYACGLSVPVERTQRRVIRGEKGSFCGLFIGFDIGQGQGSGMERKI